MVKERQIDTTRGQPHQADGSKSQTLSDHKIKGLLKEIKAKAGKEDLKYVNEQLAEIDQITATQSEKLKMLYHLYEELSAALANRTLPTLTSKLLHERLGDEFVNQGVFERIDTALNNGKKAVISAFAGTGKSTNANEYGHYLKDSGKIVRWLSSDSDTKVKIDYDQIALELGVKVDGVDKSKIIDQVNRKLTDNKNDLTFIFDNVQDYNDIREYVVNLPQQIKLILTTRAGKLDKGRKDSIKNYETIELKDFDHDQAKQLLKINKDTSLLDELVEVLGKLPLKLNQAATYLREYNVTEVRDYIDEVRNGKSAVSFLIDDLKKDGGAWQLLHYATYLDPDFVNKEILLKLLNIESSSFQEICNELAQHSLANLVSKDSSTGLKIHRLVQEDSMRYINSKYQGKSKEQEVLNDILTVLNELMPSVDESPGESWKIAKKLVGNVIAVIKAMDNGEINPNNKLAYLNAKLGSYKKYISREFVSSKEYYEQALAMYQNLYQGDHPEIARGLNNVGMAYKTLGDSRKGLEYYEQALAMYQNLYQGDHPDIARGLNNVGMAYKTLGDSRKGLEYFEQALEMSKKIYGSSHHTTKMYAKNVESSQKMCQIFSVTDVKYDNELLNHPEMFNKLSEIYGANKVLDISSQISPLLINESIEQDEPDLLLGAFMSLDNNLNEL